MLFDLEGYQCDRVIPPDSRNRVHWYSDEFNVRQYPLAMLQGHHMLHTNAMAGSAAAPTVPQNGMCAPNRGMTALNDYYDRIVGKLGEINVYTKHTNNPPHTNLVCCKYIVSRARATFNKWSSSHRWFSVQQAISLRTPNFPFRFSKSMQGAKTGGILTAICVVYIWIFIVPPMVCDAAICQRGRPT